MATKKKIAEQILRIVQGGNVSDDSTIDIREVMALVDQERDAIIKREIMNRIYAKSTTTNAAELEITGDWLTKENLNVHQNSYANLQSMPINLPNDLGIYRVEVVGKVWAKQKSKITVNTGVTGPNTVSDLSVLQFSDSPRKLDPAYRLSFTFTEGGNDHKISINIKTPNNKESFYNTKNLATAILNSSDFDNFLNEFSLENTAFSGGEGYDNVGVSGLYSFSISDVKINGKESGDTSHGFSFAVSNQVTTFAQTNISDTQLRVIINDDAYMLSYANEDYAAATPQQVAKNFADKFSYKIAMEQNIAVTYDNDVIYFEEMEPVGGFDITKSDTGELAVTLATEVESDMFSKFQKTRILTRMPSGGSHNNLFHKAATSSGREFYYLEGNKIYIYKNTQETLVLTIHYIASSRTLGSNSEYPIPADYEKEIIANTVNLFALMKKAKEDLVNDNIG